MSSSGGVDQSPAWQDLARHGQDTAFDLRRMGADPARFSAFSASAAGLFLDYSRHPVTDQSMALLFALARARDVEGWRERMFSGDKINDPHPVLHTVLRRPMEDVVTVDGANVIPGTQETLKRMRDFSARVREGKWTGRTGKKIETVVNIGIGGSDLGPRMACTALSGAGAQEMDVRFVSNLDAAALGAALQGANPETTLFLVASKTFTTQETMVNARAARQWLVAGLGDEKFAMRHFVALTANGAEAQKFGIPPENVFEFESWVGGRYSLWSSIGLPIVLKFGFDVFESFLAGAQALDRHFCDAPLEQNLPVIMALLGIWQRNFMSAASLAVLPYAENLRLLPAWLQQLDMESNGKSVDRDGRPVPYATAPVIFGVSGTDCQHSFCQMLHQGTDAVPVDFIGFREPRAGEEETHRAMLANMIAQADALRDGQTREEAGGKAEKIMPGNRASSILLMERLDAYHLGALLALYEHKIFVQGVIWNINSFDQWGVERGKIIARDYEERLGRGASGAAAPQSLLDLLSK